MAYGVRWFSEFDDIHDNVVYRVEVRERDYGGSAIEVLSADEPLVIDMSAVDNVFTPLRPQKATVKWVSQEGIDFEIGDLFIDDDRKYQLHVFEYEGATLLPKWVGWVVPIELEEPFHSKPYTVTFSATCGLPFLSDDYILDSFGAFILGEKTLAQVIATCLTSTGLELNIDTYVSLVAEGMGGGSPFPQAEIDADGLRGKYADETLAGILTPFRAFITQANGKWVIKGVVEQNDLQSTSTTFNAAGNPTGSGSTVQAAAIGRNPYPSTPHLRPTSEVVEKIAEPNSVITETVSPGIPVNRLPNGLFAGPVLGGIIPGWRNHMHNISWSRQGINRPDDPYRVEFYQHVELVPGRKKSLFQPWAYFDSGPITFNLGAFNVPEELRKETKIVLSGFMKMYNVLGTSVMVTLNEDEREFASYLLTDGEWLYSKKEAKTVEIRSNQSSTGRYIDTKGYFDIEGQSFQVESKRITNYLNRNGQAIVQLRIRIFPGAQFPRYIGAPAFVSIEDLAIIVVEDTVYEGEHKYQIDAHLPIRNANEVEYTAIIADKIDITTPEQSRDVNRVMTGYMTLTGGTTLTKGWKYPGGGGYEPIQKLSLRTSLRQMAGKRRTLEGNFLGYDVTPDISLFNRFYEPGTPSTFYTQTSWRWNVKEGTYDIAATELSLDPLPDEDLYLYDDEEGRRGNRMYRGNSTSSGGSQPKPQENPIVFDEIPPVYFNVGEQRIKVVDLLDYLVSAHEPAELLDRELHFTDWVSYVVIDRGEEGTVLDLQITAWPKEPGTDRVLVEFEGPEGEKYILIVPLVALPAIKVKSNLLEVVGGEASVLGPIPGFYEKSTTPFDISTQIKGHHLKYELLLSGYPSVVQEVEYTESGVYRYFLESGGQVLEPGQYKYTVNVYRDELIAKTETATFVIYDEEFLAKLKAYLTKSGSSIGEISLDGTSVFNNPEGANLQVVIDDVEHDSVTLQLTQDGADVPNGVRVFEVDPAVLDGTYDLFLADQELLGNYTLTVTAHFEGEEVLSRFFDFEISEKETEAEGGNLKLVTMKPGTSNYSTLGTLSLAGGSFELPDNWNILADAVSPEFDYQAAELFELRGGSLVEIDISLYTGNPQSESFTNATDEANYLFFGNSNSTKIDGIHHEPATFRAILTRRLGGASGKVVAKYSADFSFGPAVPIDDVPVEDPGSDMADYVAGAGMEEVVEDFIKRFNVRVDDESIEIFEEESPNDPDAAGLNHLRLKEKGVLYKHIQDMPADTVLGRRGTAGRPGPIPIRKSGEPIDPDELPYWDKIEELLEGSIDGTPNFIPKFGADGHSLVDSIIRQIDGKIGIGIGNPFEMLDVQGNIRATGTLISGIANGTPPIAVISSTLVHNLNVDKLDDQHGEYYLDWNNFTNYKSIIVGTGMTGGGLLDQNVNVGLDFPYLDGRYTTAASYAVSWALVNSGGLSKYNTSGVDAPFGGGGTVFHGVFLGHGSNAAYGTSIAFRNGRGFFRSIEAGSWGSWFEFATQTWVTANFVPLTRTISTGTGMLGGGPLSANLSLTLDYTYLDARYQPMVGSALPWNSVNTPGTPKFNVSSTDGPLGAASVHGIFINHGTNTSYGTSIAFRDGRGFWKSVTAGAWASTWFEFASVKYVEDTYVPLVRTISTGTGLLGGASLAANISLTLDYSYLDDRYQMNSGISVPWSSVNSAAKPRFNVNATDGPMGGTAVHGLFINHNANSNFGTTIAGRNNRLFFQSVENGSWQSWLEIASQSWVNAKQVVAGNGLTGGSSLASDPVITLGTPSTIGNSTSNMVTSTSHTHAIQVSNLVAGSNVSLSASGNGVILGPNNITISVNAFPWPNITSKPTTLSGFGIVDAPTFDYLNIQLGGKENTFAKGSLIQGGGIVLSGTLTNRLVGSGDVTISLGSVPWSSLTGVPNTLGGYGLSSTVYTKAEVNALIAGVGGINGSGSNTYHAMWGAGNTLTQSSVMQEVGGQVTISGHLVVQGGAFRPPESTGGLPPSGSIEGELRYSTTGKSMNFWNGTAWKKIQDA